MYIVVITGLQTKYLDSKLKVTTVKADAKNFDNYDKAKEAIRSAGYSLKMAEIVKLKTSEG